jgi:hypothetical protein
MLWHRKGRGQAMGERLAGLQGEHRIASDQQDYHHQERWEAGQSGRETNLSNYLLKLDYASGQ